MMYEVITNKGRFKVKGTPELGYKDAFEMCLGRHPKWTDYGDYELWRVGDGKGRGWVVKWSASVQLNRTRPTTLRLRRVRAKALNSERPGGGP